MQAGAFRIGDTAGTLDNIAACKLHRPGSVGFVSKSGGMSNEMYNVLARTTDGLYEGIAIGGDVFPGSTLSDHCLRYENIPQIRLIVVLGELGGTDEYSLVRGGALLGPMKRVCDERWGCSSWAAASECLLLRGFLSTL